MKRFITNAALALVVTAVSMVALGGSVMAASGGPHVEIERQKWSFGGFFGQYDKPQLRRGFQVYQENCAACHGLNRVYFRNLVQKGGPEFKEESVKALAADWANQIPDGPDDEGEMFERPAKLFDPMRGPFANEQAARAANNGAYPPDLSNIIKARTIENHQPWWSHVVQMARDILTGYQEAGADYLYALLTSYKEEPPEDVTMSEGMYYNTAFAGHQIAMPPPLAKDNFVEYQENAGAKASLSQNAKDLTAFLAWASDPSLNERKRIGWVVMLYLLITTVLLYLGKKRIWAGVKH